VNTIFSKYKVWPMWIQLLFAISIYIGIFCILSIIIYILSESFAQYSWDLYAVISAQKLGNGIGMIVIAILLFRLISITYFEKAGVGKIEITLTAIYSIFGIYAFIFFMTSFSEKHFPKISSHFFDLRRVFFYVKFDESPIRGFLRGNIIEILSIVIMLVIILQILYLQYSQKKTITSAVYWKIVIYLAVVFCAAYILVTSLPIPFIPITGGLGDDSVIIYITAITGLIGAVTALYTQILAGKKLNMEMELLKAQNNSLKDAKETKSKSRRKSAKRRKSKK